MNIDDRKIGCGSKVSFVSVPVCISECLNFHMAASTNITAIAWMSSYCSSHCAYKVASLACRFFKAAVSCIRTPGTS
jgi:hypothetical protein